MEAGCGRLHMPTTACTDGKRRTLQPETFNADY